MRRNAIGYLGLMGFLGLLGLITGNYGFYGFFGFFGFLGAFGGRGSDERVEQNINRACRNAFIITMVTLALSLAYIASLRATDAFLSAFVLLFVEGPVSFVASYIYYDRRGD